MQNASVIPVWKEVGQTPFEAIQSFKNKNRAYEAETISYAGRLDPMAEGVLILLVGEENKKRKEYEYLEKLYETEVVFGIETDSYDGLGLIRHALLDEIIAEDEVKKCVLELVGKRLQYYPPFSSKPVMGHPLYWWVRQGKLSEIIIPSKKIEVTSTSVISFGEVFISGLAGEVISKIKKIHGNFRQEEICEAWKSFSDSNPSKKVVSIKFQVECSSGTYIRGLAHELGQELGTGAFALSIKRTRVGTINLGHCWRGSPL